MQARYGTLRGLGRLLLAQASATGGQLRHLPEPDWTHVHRLVFVCTGNICRSPYAERRAATLGLPASSFALDGTGGRAADPGAQAAAMRRGITLDGHLSCAAVAFALRSGDLLIGMEQQHIAPLERLRRAAPPNTLQTTLLGLWSRPWRPHLHDPYCLCAAYFDVCYGVIDDGVAAIAARMGRR